MQNVADSDAFAATLTNTDHTKVPLAIVFDSAHDTLYFTENPATITGSDSLALVVGVPLITALLA